MSEKTTTLLKQQVTEAMHKFKGQQATTCTTQRPLNYRTMSGFTLIELLITTIVLAILATLAVPSFQSTIRNSAITSETNRLIAAIQYARNEAIKRNAAVVIARTSATNATWTEGWQIFQDASATAGGSGYVAANDVLIRNGDASTTGVTIMANASGNQWLAFAGNGMTTEGGTSVYHICHNNDASTGRRVSVNRAGRTTLDDIPANQNCNP